jgi:cobalamin biosynthetic protein CobC
MDPIHGFSRHGGRLAQAQAAYPDAPRPWIDLSTGVNPQPWRGRRASPAELGRLPDPDRLRALEASAARAFGLGEAGRIAAVAGAEAGLRLLPFVLGAKEVAIVGPTYGGHAEAWAVAGAQVRTACRTELEALDAEAVVLVNPNNPDGAKIAPTLLPELAARQAARGGWLIVDESFVETEPAISVAPAAGGALVVLRSFGKFYGLAGVRLGFVLAEPALIRRVRELTGDWPVSAEALAAGVAYEDLAWVERARIRLRRQSARLEGLLRRSGWALVGGSSLFRLAVSPDAPARFEGLCRRGVLTRPFAEAADRLRFGLPPPWAWKRVRAALMETAS